MINNYQHFWKESDQQNTKMLLLCIGLARYSIKYGKYLIEDIIVAAATATGAATSRSNALVHREVLEVTLLPPEWLDYSKFEGGAHFDRDGLLQFLHRYLLQTVEHRLVILKVKGVELLVRHIWHVNYLQDSQHLVRVIMFLFWERFVVLFQGVFKAEAPAILIVLPMWVFLLMLMMTAFIIVFKRVFLLVIRFFKPSEFCDLRLQYVRSLRSCDLGDIRTLQVLLRIAKNLIHFQFSEILRYIVLDVLNRVA